MEMYPIEHSNKREEIKVINHILRDNKYNQAQPYRPKKHNNCNEPPKIQKLAKFTNIQVGNETRAITKILQNADLKVAYTTTHTIRNLLSQHPTGPISMKVMEHTS
jgi:hypothetical protein